MGKRKRIDEQGLNLLASILFVQHMTTFTTTTSKFSSQYTTTNNHLFIQQLRPFVEDQCLNLIQFKHS